MPTDEGILIYRRQIKKLIKDLENGKKMPQPQQIPGEAVRTNGQDTVLYISQQKDNDRNYIRSVGTQIMKMQFEAEKMQLNERDTYIINNLKNLEKNLSTKNSYGNFK